MEDATPDPAVLLKLAKTRMPFGRYKGRLLIDLPKPYVIWFALKHGGRVFILEQLGEQALQRNGGQGWKSSLLTCFGIKVSLVP